MSAQIEIDSLRHRCQLITTNPEFDAMECRQRLSSMSETALPNALATLFDAAFQQRHDDKRIIRIRKLSLNLKLLLNDLRSSAISDILARQILDKLVQESKSPSDNYVVFDDHSHYVASFIAHILQPNRQLSWCFSDFHYAAYLSSSETLAALLLEQKDSLGAIAKHLSKMQLIESLAQKIKSQDEAWLINHWCDKPQQSSFSKSDVEFALAVFASSKQLKNIIEEISAANTQATYTHAYLKLLASLPQAKAQNLYGSLAHKGLLTLFNMLKHGSLILQMAQSSDAQNALAIDNLNVSLVNKWVMQNVFAQMKESKPIRLAILALLQMSDKHKTQEQKDQINQLEQRVKTTNKEPETLKPQFLWRGTSDYAGLSLLLPLIASLQLERYYTLSDIKDAMLYLLQAHLHLEHADTDTQLAKILDQTQEWLAYLLIDPRAPAEKAKQTGQDISCLLLGLSEEAKRKIAQQSGKQQLANILMAQFAARLSGLQLSSHAYLFKQFLHTHGSIAIRASSAHISLRPIALNIVLKMSGYSPYIGNIPSSGFALTIEVQE